MISQLNAFAATFPFAQLLWWVFASMAVGGGLGMVTRKNPVASLLFLILTFFSLAAIYILLGAHFIGAIQVIVYAGAIMVLFLFTIMLLNLGHDYQSDIRGGLWVIVAFIFAGTIGFAVWYATADKAAIVQMGGAKRIAGSVDQMNAVGAIAQPLFRDFAVPFELTSLLLLVAVIGAVLLAKRRV
jgi:NADH-quinone oxidoreductase subunit J